MSEKLETRKYTFTVEGETEQWYLFWLRDQINTCPERTYNVSIDAKVQQSPKKFFKNANAKATPKVIHICDVESNDKVHTDQFQNILDEMKEAKTQKGIVYNLGYSNFAFELWIVLHKRDCNGSLNHRKQYLDYINLAFGEKFENLDQYKHGDNFKRCLSKLKLEDVKNAIRRSDAIMERNRQDQKKLIKYKGYAYYRENPALSIHEAVREMFIECGLIKK
ncbi:MAG: RloB family protein [Clostridiales bacterium]|nr:RloB family protein [Clostridiales bacterium]MDY3747837.1 RloB domain-containing protein [Lachnospiraceae bacterium]